MPITRTSIRHPAFRNRLDRAMRIAAIGSAKHAYGFSSAGSIQVMHSRPLSQHAISRSAFHFFDTTTGREISNTVRAALREVNPTGANHANL